MRRYCVLLIFLELFIGCTHPQPLPSQILKPERESHLKGIRQLTFSGINAKARWSFDSKSLSFQRKDAGCEQVYRVHREKQNLVKISNGLGTAVDSAFLPKNNRILYSSTQAVHSDCQTHPNSDSKILFLDRHFQIYGSLLNGTDPVPLEPGAPRAYNAEAITCQDGSVIFTSNREGHPQLYKAALDSFGSFRDVKRFHSSQGYQGGASFSADCKKITWHESSPKTKSEIKKFKTLLQKHRVDVSTLEIWIANADGSDAHAVTHLNAMSYAPTFTPRSDALVFASNFQNQPNSKVDLFWIRTDGTGLKHLTEVGDFNGFPQFSPDGNYLAFTSTRNPNTVGAQLFIAEWVD